MGAGKSTKKSDARHRLPGFFVPVGNEYMIAENHLQPMAASDAATVARTDIRNIAIIAHVDHGKTTLVDGMLRQTKVFRDNQEVMERVMDSNDLERERGITILAKNTSVEYKGVTINIVDTPGHADFGGEVERIMHMVDGVLLLVDAVEGPMPQTRFVLRQALERGLPAIVVVNKIDRPAARPDYVVNATFDLFIDLGATDEQAEFPVVYTRALEQRAGFAPDALGAEPGAALRHDPRLPAAAADRPGRADAVAGRHHRIQQLRRQDRRRSPAERLDPHRAADCCASRPTVHAEPAKVTQVYTFRNLQRTPVSEVSAGSIVAVAGIENVGIGDTLADPADPRPLPPITVEEPTVRMTFCGQRQPLCRPRGPIPHQPPDPGAPASTNWSATSPCASRRRTRPTSSSSRAAASCIWPSSSRPCAVRVMNLPSAVPRSSSRKSDEVRLEPIEQVFVEVAQEYLGAVQEMLGRRRALMQNIHYGEDGTVYCTYLAPTRGLLGFRQPFLTSTRGTGIYHTLFHGYEPYTGDIELQQSGALVALESGQVSRLRADQSSAARYLHRQARRSGLCRPGRRHAHPR